MESDPHKHSHDDEYQMKKTAAIKGLWRYLVGITVFMLINIATIVIIPGYSFPENFWAIWPIVGWGAVVFIRFISLRQYK